jgi:hypothetical protein
MGNRTRTLPVCSAVPQPTAPAWPRKKKVTRIICGINNRDSCRNYFKELKILALQSLYMFSIWMLLANINYYKFYSDIHNINTRHITDLYQPSSSLSVFKNGTFNMGIKIFNKLPPEIQVLIHDTKLFKKVLKIFYSNSFYTIEEYFNYPNKQLYCPLYYTMYTMFYSYLLLLFYSVLDIDKHIFIVCVCGMVLYLVVIVNHKRTDRM